MTSSKVFFAYPSNPSVIGQPIENAINKSRDVKSWKALDVYGHFIAEEVVAGINSCNTFVADISVLNFNVTYEIGYAIGKQKRVLFNVINLANGFVVQIEGSAACFMIPRKFSAGPYRFSRSNIDCV